MGLTVLAAGGDASDGEDHELEVVGHLAVNLFGTYSVTQAFLPLLTLSRGAIVNVLSNTASAPLPFIPAYSISKAAAFNLSQSTRALLAGRGVRVHVVLAGPVDTDMSRDFDGPKASPSPLREAALSRPVVLGALRHCKVGVSRSHTCREVQGR